MGIWLTRSGRPLSRSILTAHKLAALATTVLAVQAARALLIGRGAVPPALLAAGLAIGGSIIALFATGAVLSAGRQVQGMPLTVHLGATVAVAVLGLLGVLLR